jgi:hypothetical protein
MSHKAQRFPQGVPVGTLRYTHFVSTVNLAQGL